MFSDKIREVVSIALKSNAIFALYVMPDEDEVHFVASKNVCMYDEHRGNGFFINSFNNAYGMPVLIPDELSLDDAACYFKESEAKMVSLINPVESSTDRGVYIERTKKCHSRLAE